MRNLKKFLALVLAMLMVVSASAAVSADFTDVAADSQYAEAINDLAGKEIVKGVSTTEFGLDADVTRLQMALFIARACTGEVDNVWTNGVVPFTDVTEYKGAVQYAFLNGIIAGRDDVTFDPKGGIAYQDALTMAVRALGYEVTLADYPLNAYKKAAALGLTDGINTVSELTETLNRAETAQIIQNMIYADRADSELTFAAENFDKVVVRTSDLFVITATPKQSYAIGYNATSDNSTGTYVGVQPLVNGVPTGEMIYLTAAELSIEEADVEDYINYTVELINYDAKTGKFDDVKLGEAPDVVYRNNGATIASNGKLTVDGVVYNFVDNTSGSARINEIVAFAGSNVQATTAKYLLEDEDGYVYAGTSNSNVVWGAPVAKRVNFGGSNTKYYAVLSGNLSGQIIDEATALDEWGFTTSDVQYTKYATLTGAAINNLGGYELQLFDDDKDGLYDRAIANKIWMSIYNTSGSGANTVVTNVADADLNTNDNVIDSQVKLNAITYTDASVKSKGTIYVYTWNDQLKQVNVIDIVKPQSGTLTLVNAVNLNSSSTEDDVVYTIDGKKYTAYYVENSAAGATQVPATTVSAVKLGATIVGATLNPSNKNFAAVKNDGALRYTNAFDLINIQRVRIPVNFYAYNGIALYVEPVAATNPTSYLTVMSELVDLDDAFENLEVDMYVNGKLDEQLVAKIDGKEIAKLSTWQLGTLLGREELFYPGLVYRTNINADGEYTLIETLDPTNATSITAFGLKSAAASVDSNNQIAFESGISTINDFQKKILTDSDTVFYFIDRTLNDSSEIKEGNLTKVRTYVGMPDDAAINVGANTIVLADKIGLTDNDFANVVIVYEAEGTNGFGYVQSTSSIVYVPRQVLQVTQAGTAAELGLGAEYTEDNYYYYANAAIDLETGNKVGIITTEILSATATVYTGAVDQNGDPVTAANGNVDAIYEIDANGVVIETLDIYGNPVNGANSYFMTREEAVTAGILEKVENAVVTYHAGMKRAIVHKDQTTNNVAIDLNDNVTSLTVFPIGGNIGAAANFVTNANVNNATKMGAAKYATFSGSSYTETACDKIDGGEVAYFLANSLADGSVTILFGPTSVFNPAT